MTSESQDTATIPAKPTDEECNWGVAAHLLGFLGAWIAVGVLGPLAVYLTKGRELPFVREHSMEAINFNIVALVASLIGALAIPLLGLGFLILAFVGVVYLVTSIMGAVAASRGESYRYPLTIRFIK